MAAIAIPALSAARVQAGDAAARTELSSVMVAQESYFVEQGVYARSLADLEYTDDPEVTTTILRADAYDYALCARHPRSVFGWRVDSERVTVEPAAGEC